MHVQDPFTGAGNQSPTTLTWIWLRVLCLHRCTDGGRVTSMLAAGDKRKASRSLASLSLCVCSAMNKGRGDLCTSTDWVGERDPIPSHRTGGRGIDPSGQVVEAMHTPFALPALFLSFFLSFFFSFSQTFFSSLLSPSPKLQR